MADELLRQLAPPLPPDQLSAWPLGPGWWMLFGALAGLLLVTIGILSRRWPWWRWPRVWRWRRLYQQALTREVLPAPVSSGALNHWVRQLARDGLGVDPTLPPAPFLTQLQHQLNAQDDWLVATLHDLLNQTYQPFEVQQPLDTEPTAEILRTLCKRCLTLHSPGLG